MLPRPRAPVLRSVYGSLREMAGVRYWGIGMGAVL
jgi:hypothetical protein